MKSIARLIILLLVSAVLTISMMVYWAQQPLHLPADQLEFTIPPGSSMRAIANQISAAGVPVPPLLLNLLARAQSRASRLKAGTYVVESGITPLSLLDKLERGDVSLLEVLIPEGMSFEQMRTAMDLNPGLKHDTAGLSGAEILRSIGAKETHPEGLFFPDTYRFARGTSELEIYKLAYQAQQKHLTEAWQTRAADLPFQAPYEALILASIVEKETARPEDRSHIAAVFINRLRLGMPLQTDPAVIYGVGKNFDGNLRKIHLLTDTPYNTYTRLGLPPTPIAMPGHASLAAALNPAHTDDLYFVARGDGSSVFSKNLNEHTQAVNKYQRNQKP